MVKIYKELSDAYKKLEYVSDKLPNVDKDEVQEWLQCSQNEIEELLSYIDVQLGSIHKTIKGKLIGFKQTMPKYR